MAFGLSAVMAVGSMDLTALAEEVQVDDANTEVVGEESVVATAKETQAAAEANEISAEVYVGESTEETSTAQTDAEEVAEDTEESEAIINEVIDTFNDEELSTVVTDTEEENLEDLEEAGEAFTGDMSDAAEDLEAAGAEKENYDEAVDNAEEAAEDAADVAADAKETTANALSTVNAAIDTINGATSITVVNETYNNAATVVANASASYDEAVANYEAALANYNAAIAAAEEAEANYDSLINGEDGAVAELDAALEDLKAAQDAVDALEAELKAAQEAYAASSIAKIVALETDLADDTTRNWSNLDDLFYEIVKAYYVPEVLNGTIKEGSTIKFKKYSTDSYNYCVVTYIDNESGEEKTIVLNYKLSNSCDGLEIFEKEAETTEVGNGTYTYSYTMADGTVVSLTEAELATALSNGTVVYVVENADGTCYTSSKKVEGAYLAYVEEGKTVENFSKLTEEQAADENGTETVTYTLVDGNLVKTITKSGNVVTYSDYNTYSSAAEFYSSAEAAKAANAYLKIISQGEGQEVVDATISGTDEASAYEVTLTYWYQKRLEKKGLSLDWLGQIEGATSKDDAIGDTVEEIYDKYPVTEGYADVDVDPSNIEGDLKFGLFGAGFYKMSGTYDITYNEVTEETIDFTLIDEFKSWFGWGEDSVTKAMNQYCTSGEILKVKTIDWNLKKATVYIAKYSSVDVTATGKTKEEAMANAIAKAKAAAQEANGSVQLKDSDLIGVAYTVQNGNKVESSETKEKYSYTVNYRIKTTTPYKNVDESQTVYGLDNLSATENTDTVLTGMYLNTNYTNYLAEANEVNADKTLTDEEKTAKLNELESKYGIFSEYGSTSSAVNYTNWKNTLISNNEKINTLEAKVAAAKASLAEAQEKVIALQEKVASYRIDDATTEDLNGLEVKKAVWEVQLAQAEADMEEAASNLAAANEALAVARTAADAAIVRLTPSAANEETGTDPIAYLPTTIAAATRVLNATVQAPTIPAVTTIPAAAVPLAADGIDGDDGDDNDAAVIAEAETPDEEDDTVTIENAETPLAADEQNSLKFWWWIILLIIAACGGATYIYNKNSKTATENGAKPSKKDKNKKDSQW